MVKFVAGMLAGALFAASMVAVATPAKAAQPLISGGSVSAACTITPTEFDLLGDGSFLVTLQTQLNGAVRTRHNAISADGTTFTLDGVAVASPPAALQALGTHLAAATPKITAAYSAPAVQTVLCGP